MKRSSRLTSSAAGLAAEGDLDAVEEPVEARVGLDLRAPRRAAAAATGSTVTMRTRAPALGEPPGEVELRDVAAEEVLEVDRRDRAG